MFAVLPVVSVGVGALYALKRTYRYSVKTAAATRIQSVCRMYLCKTKYKKACLENTILMKLTAMKEPSYKSDFNADDSDVDHEEDFEFARQMRKHMKTSFNKSNVKQHRMLTRRRTQTKYSL